MRAKNGSDGAYAQTDMVAADSLARNNAAELCD
jgi:hypothetical protein